MVHNHPSGDPTPSVEDINITARIYEAGRIIGIELADHIIIGDNRYTSMKEKGLF
jgi:DNA repair protein RadC